MRPSGRDLALLLLALLAIAAGANMVAASSRFVTAYETYDRLELSLSRFHFTSPDAPVETEFVITNPTGQPVTILAVELRLQLGVHDIGGGEVRPGAILQRGESFSTPVELAINDTSYVRRAAEPLDWRVSGRVQVRLNPAIDPVWVPFVVRYLPE